MTARGACHALSALAFSLLLEPSTLKTGFALISVNFAPQNKIFPSHDVLIFLIKWLGLCLTETGEMS